MDVHMDCDHVDDCSTRFPNSDVHTMIQGDGDYTVIHANGNGNDSHTIIRDGDGHTVSLSCDAQEEQNATIHDDNNQTRIHDDGDDDYDDVHTMHHRETGHTMFHGDEHSMFHGGIADSDRHDAALWIPGYESHGSSLYLETSTSSRQHHSDDYADKEKFNRFLELEKLYENMSESSYDLSLKDIVDPSYTISGNLKAIIGEDVLKSQAQEATSNATAKRRNGLLLSFDRMVSLDFSLCGLRGKRIARARPNLSALKRFPKDNSTAKPYLNIEDSRKRHEANYGFAKSRVHPTNECSTCSSYTVFFKCRCLACGKMYCSNCAKHYMESFIDGRKCKGACSDRPSGKRMMSRRVASGYWCFYSSNYLYKG